MTYPFILGHGVFLLGVFLVAFVRLGARRCSERDTVAVETRERIPLERLPDSSSLAGVPLRILLSERSDPGAALRDTLMIRPSTRDP